MTEAWKQYEGQIADGKFHLRQYLGGSNGSAVFLTEISAAPQPEKAAIKIVLADPRNAEVQLSRWKQTAKLSHPNLLKLFDSGRCRLGDLEFLYVVMEAAEEDVSQILPHRALTLPETRDMLGPVLDALAYLHAKGFVHGHIKPTNIAAVDEHIKISVDGICRAGDANLVNHPTSPYDPPEIATEKASPAEDVWSLGMALVEVLTQRLPPWERMGQKDPQIREALPPPLLDIARNCLRRDPRSRITIQAFAARLQAATPVLAAQRDSPPPPAHRNPPAAAPQEYSWKIKLTAAVIVAIVAAAAIFTITKSLKHEVTTRADLKIAAEPTPSPAPPKSDPAPVIAEKKAVAAETIAPAPPPQPEPAKNPAPEIVPGKILHQALPEVPQSASETISGTIKVVVKVSVDAAGNVVQASLDSSGPSKYFANLALKAAQRWSFSPAQSNGQAVPSEWSIRFEFTRGAVNAFPRQSP